ncbi:DUF1826 domain-containing protein [Epibacterium ulvae]|uniref:DUF1826 domain-containing protein n=1 Tax=Epibacterium ulvae TaxID=1156985 RepID=UPI001BFC184F|nr:DUF1826 domain-containing protein [Epibacterium ulvae]MBT8155613.1 DUF1826 domain-containing protein [Epibacterium ulvae]
MATQISDFATAPGLKSVAVVEGRPGLSAIRDPGCAAVIWQRQLGANVTDWLGALSPDQLPRARAILLPNRVAEAVDQICDTCGTPEGPQRTTLTDDIAALSAQFAEMMAAPYLRLDVVTTNACRKFHIDAVTARLVCTYRGQATQFGEADQGHDPDMILSAPLACPAVLRGTKWAGDAPPRLRHRSPPIEGTGETRLVLVLDPIYDMEEEV